MTDNVDHPPHYTNGKIETIDCIEVIIAPYDPVMGWSIGQVIKYCARAPLKADLKEDLKKARWYLDRAIQHAEGSI